MNVKYYEELIIALLQTLKSDCEIIKLTFEENKSLRNKIECLENQLAKAEKENE